MAHRATPILNGAAVHISMSDHGGSRLSSPNHLVAAASLSRRADLQRFFANYGAAVAVRGVARFERVGTQQSASDRPARSLQVQQRYTG